MNQRHISRSRKWRVALAMTLGLALFLTGCGDDPVDATETTDETAQCTDDTGTVTVTVSGDTPPVFNWDPACSVARFLIEEGGGSDLWFIFTDNSVWDNPAQANLITPPVTYGVLPTGVQQSGVPQTLTSGVLQVLLVRILPDGSTASCVIREDNACLLVVVDFTLP